MITPGAIPQITGDMDACSSHGFMVSVLGSRFADTGAAVMRSWSGLSGVYVAPESGVLLAAMVPVAFTAGSVGADLNAAGSAIMSYATAVRPIKARLQGLVSEASAFVAYAGAHGDWDTDQSRVDQHNAMLTEVNDLMARWEAAERSCANTVDALYGGTQYGVNNGDGTASANEYGLTAELWGSVATGKQGVPWGTAAGRDKPWFEDVGDAVGGFLVGVGHGVTGLVTGLGGFVGFQGWDVMGQSWKGLGALAIVAVSPQMMVSGQGFPGYQPGEIQATVTGMGKGLIAYDQWSSDPAQAAGESVFNIATFFIPVGGAAAGTAKAASAGGKAAGVVGVAGKAAKVADVVKASRVADVVAGVRTTLGLRLNNAANVLHTALGGPDRALAGPGPLHLPEAPVPHTPDLHATTIHPDPGSVASALDGTPAAPHPHGEATPAVPGSTLHGAPGATAPVDVSRIGTTGPAPSSLSQTIDNLSLTNQQRGALGEALTRRAVEATPGNPIVGTQVEVVIHGSKVRADFLVSNASGQLSLVESKYGPGGRYTPNQNIVLPNFDQGPQGFEFAKPSDAAAVSRAMPDGLPVPTTIDAAQTLRWQGRSGTLAMTEADLRGVIDDLSSRFDLQVPQSKLLTNLKDVFPVG